MELGSSQWDVSPAETIDVRGKTCPYPVLETGAALRKMKTGEILEVLVDYEPSVGIGLPNLCNRYGYKYSSVKQKTTNGNGFWKFYIKRSDKL